MTFLTSIKQFNILSLFQLQHLHMRAVFIFNDKFIKFVVMIK